MQFSYGGNSFAYVIFYPPVILHSSFHALWHITQNAHFDDKFWYKWYTWCFPSQITLNTKSDKHHWKPNHKVSKTGKQTKKDIFRWHFIAWNTVKIKIRLNSNCWVIKVMFHVTQHCSRQTCITEHRQRKVDVITYHTHMQAKATKATMDVNHRIATLQEALLLLGTSCLEQSTIWSDPHNVHCVQKKHPLTFSFISSCLIRRFKQKLQWVYLRNGRFWQCKN